MTEQLMMLRKKGKNVAGKKNEEEEEAKHNAVPLRMNLHVRAADMQIQNSHRAYSCG